MPRGSYNTADDGEGHGSDAKTRREAQHSGGETAWSRWYRVTAVCEMLLCVLLLTAITVLWINYHIFKRECSQLQTSNNTLTTERDQLQKGREQLQRETAELQGFLNLGWNYSNSSVYNISTEQKNWTESRQNCRERGADLVIINSTEEQDLITKLLHGGGRAWIGLSDRDRENKFKWVDDTPLITGFWKDGEHNAATGDDGCVIAGASDHVNNWAYVNCNKENNWICEKTFFN